MPHKKEIAKKPQKLISPDVIHYLQFGEWPENPSSTDPWERFCLSDDDILKKLWEAARDTILDEWIRRLPGCRPWGWWRYDSPEPRKRIGGIGDAAHDFFALVPRYSFGLPVQFVTKEEADYYNGRLLHVDGHKVGPYREGHFKGLPIDHSDPPVYESEASYLRRLGLLTREEIKILRNRVRVWRPEVVNYE